MSDLFAVGAEVIPVFPITRRIGWQCKGVVVERFPADPINYPKGGLVVDFAIRGTCDVDRVVVEEFEVIDCAALERAWKRAGL